MGEITRSGAAHGKLRFRHVGIPRLVRKIGLEPLAIKPSGPRSADISCVKGARLSSLAALG
jgi:hypothetical protein